ncbi:MAG: hypothetical protein DRG80_07570 [Deltaproteobacteria bacterium]|nr:MAG: hypothetical protein DRG80_07570 [Deltaproteobacteria bacterium]
MTYSELNHWLRRQIPVPKRLQNVCFGLILFLMISARKHSLKAASQFSGLHISQFSRFLLNHRNLAIASLSQLSRKQSKVLAKRMRFLANNKLPWKIAIIIDSTLQTRFSRHSDNVKRFNHGAGFVIGHQWTNIVLIINDQVIPLPPIPFHSKRYCRLNKIQYETENVLVCKYLRELNLEEYIGVHDPKHVVVLADSGYDSKDIEKTIASKKWIYIIALKKNRTVKTVKLYENTAKSKGWLQVAILFKKYRCLKWSTVRVPVNSTRKKRMEFRIRQITGYLRNVGKTQLICSEFKKRPQGRRKYLACNDFKAAPRQILIGYRLRWAIEIFHKHIKMFLGFEDVATKWFAAVESHVHWVYCAYILMNLCPIRGVDKNGSIAQKQEVISHIVRLREKSRVRQLLTRFNGVDVYKNELQQALAVA